MNDMAIDWIYSPRDFTRNRLSSPDGIHEILLPDRIGLSLWEYLEGTSETIYKVSNVDLNLPGHITCILFDRLDGELMADVYYRMDPGYSGPTPNRVRYMVSRVGSKELAPASSR